MTITLDTRDKFFAMIDAVQQFIDNCNDAEHLIDDAQIDEFHSKLTAAEQIRDQLDAALASLADDDARSACLAGEPVACPDAHTCRHGIDN